MSTWRDRRTDSFPLRSTPARLQLKRSSSRDVSRVSIGTGMCRTNNTCTTNRYTDSKARSRAAQDGRGSVHMRTSCALIPNSIVAERKETQTGALATEGKRYPAAVQTERPLTACVCLNGHKFSCQACRERERHRKEGEEREMANPARRAVQGAVDASA